MATTKDRSALGVKVSSLTADLKSDAKLLGAAAPAIRERLINDAGLDTSETDMIGRAIIKVGNPTSGATREVRRRGVEVHAPDTNSGNCWVVSVGWNHSGPERIAYALKGLARVAASSNGKAKRCQEIMGRLGFSDVHPYSLDETTESNGAVAAWAADLSEKHGGGGVTLTKVRKATRQATANVRIMCGCVNPDGHKYAGQPVRIETPMPEMFLGSAHQGTRDNGSPACGKMFKLAPRRKNKRKGEASTTVAA